MRRILLIAVVLTLTAGSASAQMAPTVPVGPAPNKPFDEFQQDNYLCRSYADQQVAGLEQRETNQVVGGAVVGTVLGAGLGAAIGGGRGAAIGAGTGAVVGTVGGSAQAQQTQAYAQRRYDTAFGQCMYARGDQVAGYPPPAAYYPPPPPPASYAAPPPGYYPPPAYPPPPPASYAPPPGYPPPPGYYPPPGYPPPAN
jgi:uncharacterized protein YcfJ